MERLSSTKFVVSIILLSKKLMMDLLDVLETS